MGLGLKVFIDFKYKIVHKIVPNKRQDLLSKLQAWGS